MHVPLHRPFPGSRLQSNIRGQPGLRARCAKGRPKALRELRNLTGCVCTVSVNLIYTHMNGLLSREPRDNIINEVNLSAPIRHTYQGWVDWADQQYQWNWSTYWWSCEGDPCFGATVLTCQEEVENWHQQSRATEWKHHFQRCDPSTYSG